MTLELTLERRVARLEARAEIAELVGAYCVSCDDRDVDRLRSLFTEDAVVRSKDGVMTSRGRDAVMEMYAGRFRALGATCHWTHDHAVAFDAKDDNAAAGFVMGHAECWRNGKTLVASIRYDDVYRRVGGRWLFASRALAFLYYMPVEEYAQGLGDTKRQRAYGDRRPADFPESLPTWVEGRFLA